MTARPNILFILSDQHNARVRGGAGDPWARTPNLDALAAGGVSLDNCYCASPLCVPSRASLLSGLLPHRTGVHNNMQALRSDQATFVHSLAAGGYETVLAGRMHFVGADQRHGYERRLVGDITPTHIGQENPIYGDALKGTPGQTIVSVEKSGGGHSPVLAYDRDVTDAACACLRAARARPLFLTVGLYGPHCPYVAPEDLYAYYYDLLPHPEGFSPEDREKQHPFIRNFCAQRGITTLPAAAVRRARAAYYALVERMDGLVGEILAAARAGLDMTNTLVVYASDHGDMLGRHGLFWKSNFYDGAARVPAVFSWPGRFPGGGRLRAPSSLLDFAPTLLRLADSPDLPAYDGMDLGEGLRTGADLPGDRTVIAECADLKGDPPCAMARNTRYKLVRFARHAQPQLFDMEHDPDETRNLADDPAHRAARDTLERELARRWTPEKALAEHALAKQHFTLLKQWTAATGPASVEKWSCGRA